MIVNRKYMSFELKSISSIGKHRDHLTPLQEIIYRHFSIFRVKIFELQFSSFESKFSSFELKFSSFESKFSSFELKFSSFELQFSS